ncbi:MAG: hypothetical protein ACYTDT_00185 [Planctomycetota bacterium]|jgi:hypothetical protein
MGINIEAEAAMKTTPLLAACLLLAGCGYGSNNADYSRSGPVNACTAGCLPSPTTPSHEIIVPTIDELNGSVYLQLRIPDTNATPEDWEAWDKSRTKLEPGPYTREPEDKRIYYLQVGMGAKHEDLAHMSRLTSLQRISMDWCEKLTDESLALLKNHPELEELVLDWNNNYTDAGLKHLHGLKKLRYIKMSLCKGITDAGVEALQAALPKCVIKR